MTDIDTRSPIHKVHAGLSYSIVLRPNDSTVYLDIEELGLHNHKVSTACKFNEWDDLEKDGDQAAATIIDLHNAAPKGLL